MRKPETRREWILLIHQLPPTPTNLRVQTWRKLQKLGAVSIKNSVYVLPFNEKAHEDFQWLKQEIESAGGEAVVFRADSVEGATDDEIIASFRRERDEDYERIRAELEALVGMIREEQRGGRPLSGRLGNYETELGKLHHELERIIRVDFFVARKGGAATAAYERCRKALEVSHSRKAATAKSGAAGGAALDLAEYQGRRWITRRNLHIDRLASAWLIKRWIDKRPRFLFVADGERVEGGIAFDMFGAEFTHHAEDCTFETLIKRFGLNDDKALRAIAEIVHDIDLKDDKFHRLEAAGLDATVSGLAALIKDDRKLIGQCCTIFDGLYALLSQDAEKNGGKQDGGEQYGRRSRVKAGTRVRRGARQ